MTTSSRTSYVWQSLASISGTVWNDLDGDGHLSTGERPLSGARITLTGDGGATAQVTTGANGQYTFSNLSPGNYSVGEQDPRGYASTNDADGPLNGTNTISMTLEAGQALANQDFFDQGTASIGDTVWVDTDGNEVQNDNEQGIYNVALQLTWWGPDITPGTGDDYVFPVQTTNVFGNYTFANLPPGQFQLTIDDSSPTLASLVRTVPSFGDTYYVGLSANAQFAAADFAYQLSTSVQIVDFSTSAEPSAIRLAWQAMLHGNPAPAFHVLRAGAGAGQTEQPLTSSPISPTTENGQTAGYAYADGAVRPGRVYLYWLESEDGMRYGPWQVRASVDRIYLPALNR